MGIKQSICCLETLFRQNYTKTKRWYLEATLEKFEEEMKLIAHERADALTSPSLISEIEYAKLEKF